MRPAETGSGPVGLADTYSTLTRCGAAAVPPPNPACRARRTASAYQAGETRTLTKPGPATSALAIHALARAAAASSSAISRGGRRSGLASRSASVVA